MMSECMLLSLAGRHCRIHAGVLPFNFELPFQLPTAVPMESDFTPDWHAAVFVFALAVVCGIGFSLVPALRATKGDLTPALKEGSALQVPGYLRFGLRNMLMVSQVAGSLMLL